MWCMDLEIYTRINHGTFLSSLCHTRIKIVIKKVCPHILCVLYYWDGVKLFPNLPTQCLTVLRTNDILYPHNKVRHNPFNKSSWYSETEGEKVSSKIENSQWAMVHDPGSMRSYSCISNLPPPLPLTPLFPARCGTFSRGQALRDTFPQ